MVETGWGVGGLKVTVHALGTPPVSVEERAAAIIAIIVSDPELLTTINTYERCTISFSCLFGEVVPHVEQHFPRRTFNSRRFPARKGPRMGAPTR